MENQTNTVCQSRWGALSRVLAEQGFVYSRWTTTRCGRRVIAIARGVPCPHPVVFFKNLSVVFDYFFGSWIKLPDHAMSGADGAVVLGPPLYVF